MRHLTIILTSFCLCNTWVVQSQSCKQDIVAWQNELNEQFRDHEKTPLSKKDLRKFDGLNFFPIDTNYCIKARFVQTPNELPFNMLTTTDRLPVYVKYGLVIFSLHGKEYQLPVYKSLTLLDTDSMEDYLFLPFTDETNGIDSYGGGRYLDLTIPEGDTILLDFNKAYNPSCAYNENYSCPIPPRENRLPVEIRAGVKDWAGNN